MSTAPGPPSRLSEAAATTRRIARGLGRRGRRGARRVQARFRRSPADAGPPPSPPLCCLATPLHYGDPGWRLFHEELATYSYDLHVFLPEIYRKGWEWTQTIWGLQRLGMLRPDARAIGVGAGRESVIFWLADHLGYVLATDLYGNDLWSTSDGKEADAAILSDPQQFSRRPVDPAKLAFLPMNGLQLGVRTGSFDMAWSLSSIEHFGGHEAAAQAVAEMARVVRPGGVVAVATEVLLLDEYRHPEYFTREQFEEHVVRASPLLTPIEPMDWTLPPTEYLIDSVVFPERVTRTRRHMVLNDGYVQWTSGITFLRRS